MFRKHIFFAALLLASTISTAQAGNQDCICPNLGCIPTCTTDYPTICCDDTTFANAIATFNHTNATNMGFSPTLAKLSGDNGLRIPTVFPQQMVTMDAMLSTGHDYTTASVSTQEQKMVNLLNQNRKNNGLSPLPLDTELSRIARIKSADMRDEGYFAHESPTYGKVRDMLKHFGYRFTGAGENIAHHANVDKAQAAFMSSTGHRANILGKTWTKMGIGIVYDRNGYIYATQIFAR